MKKAVQIGARRIGRGFMGQLFYESGYEIVFVDVTPELVHMLNERDEYRIRITSPPAHDVPVSHFRAVDGRELEKVARELLDADIACTAVGAGALPHIAPGITKAIELRAKHCVESPLNILICENASHGDDILKNKVYELLPEEYHDYAREHIGYVMAVVGRMVSEPTEQLLREDPLLIVTEAYKRLPVNRDGFIGQIPKINGLEPKSQFQTHVDEKLFVHNCSHAITAYLGYLKGYEFIYQAIRDANIRQITAGALQESCTALVAGYGYDPEEQRAYAEDLLVRFENPALGDSVVRVGGDPARKLAPDDRLIGAANFALSQGVFPENICKGIAAALLFDHPADPSAERVQNIVKNKGYKETLIELGRLDPNSPIISTVMGLIPNLKKQ